LLSLQAYRPRARFLEQLSQLIGTTFFEFESLHAPLIQKGLLQKRSHIFTGFLINFLTQYAVFFMADIFDDGFLRPGPVGRDSSSAEMRAALSGITGRVL
jgi:hypothetical protein